MLPLSICYRCSQAVIREAQKIDKEIEGWEGSPEGSVSTITLKEFRLNARPGDVALCRTTAPVVQECLWFIRNGKKAVVKGREIGKNLVELVLNLAGGNFKMPTEDLLEVLTTYYDLETEKNRRNNKEDKQILLDDKVDTIKAVVEDCRTVGDVKNKFAAIFGDEDREAITLMTIHKAKGLEAQNVFILRPDQLPHKLAKTAEALQAEENLKFVAITRAELNLYWVRSSDADSVDTSIPAELREPVA
jgi:superfamily I DNA/RNA helicase